MLIMKEFRFFCRGGDPLEMYFKERIFFMKTGFDSFRNTRVLF